MAVAGQEAQLWRYVEYRCGSCHEWCLVDHAERAAKMRECKDCARIPAIEDEIRDHRLTSLLWAHKAAVETTARTGEGGQVLGGRAALTRDRPDRPAGSGGLFPDPEAGPQEADGRRPKTSGGEAQCRLNDFIHTDGGERGR